MRERAIPELRIDGAPLAPAVAEAVTAIVVRQRLGRPAIAEIAFEAVGGGPLPDVASGTPVSLAAPAGPPLFLGRIAGREHRRTTDGRRILRLRAHDALHGLRLRRRFRRHDAGAAAAWSAAAGELGLGFSSTEESPARQSVQNGVSDLAFLVGLAAEEGLHPTLHGDRLHLVSLAGLAETLDLAWGEGLHDAEVDEAGESLARLARTYAWNAADASAFTATRPLARQDSEIELRGFGLDSLEAEEGEILLANRMARDETGAGGAAQAELDGAAAATCLARGRAAGDARLAPGIRLRLSGVLPSGPVTVVVTEATHVIDAESGYVTHFSTDPPPAGGTAASAPVATLGTVVDIADPEGGAKCKVALPAYGGLELGPFGVVVAGAGAGKGAAALPDLGDEVVVLFPTGDLSQGLVLGGLYGARHRPPRSTTVQEPRAVVIASGSEQRLVLGGRDKRLSLSTAGGDTLGLGGGHSRLSVAGDLLVSAVGGSITFKADRIFFERG